MITFYAMDSHHPHSDILGGWTLEESRATYNAHPIIPDASVEIVINCGAPLLWYLKSGTSVELPPIFIKGLQQKPLLLQVSGRLAQLVGLRLSAWAVPFLPDVSIKPPPEAITPLGGIWQSLVHTIRATVLRSGYAEAVYQLQQFVSDSYPHPRDLDAVRAVGKRLNAAQGHISIRELAGYSPLSLSQLERQFKGLTGITLKRYARLVRFEAARNQLHGESTRRLSDLTYELGYADQAHFTHDFRAFADETPQHYAAYVRQNRALNADFLQDISPRPV